MAFTEVLTGDTITAEQFSGTVDREYIGQLWWKHLMGMGGNMPIQVKEELTKKPGDAITINLR